MVCGKCWRSVSGGVVDGDEQHPDYRSALRGHWIQLGLNVVSMIKQLLLHAGMEDSGKTYTSKTRGAAEEPRANIHSSCWLNLNVIQPGKMK